MSDSKAMAKLVKELQQKGWEVWQGGKHYRARHPSGALLTISCTPRCPHAYRNALADIRRIERQSEKKGVA